MGVIEMRKSETGMDWRFEGKVLDNKKSIYRVN